MNRFRTLGLISYNGRIQVHKALLNVVLCVSIGGRDRAEKFRKACAFIMHMASGRARAGIQTGGDSINTLERLARLRDAGVISAAEFNSKKAQILSRL
jgi:hypothetical protein